jgi:formylglycine-generating enzyme required for sulfatase activity
MLQRLMNYFSVSLTLSACLFAIVQLKAGDAPSDDKEESELPKTVALDLASVKMEFVLINPKLQPDRGVFLMGSPQSERDGLVKQYRLDPNALDNEKEREVELTRPYYMGKVHVTRGQFAAFVKATNYQTNATTGTGGYGWNAVAERFEKDKKYTWENPGFAQTDNHPVVNVSWNDAKRFCRWMTEDSGLQRQLQAKLAQRTITIRLPSEAEWEYAYRGGSKTRYCFGNDGEDLAKHANVADGTAREKFTTWKNSIRSKDGYIFTAPAGTFDPNPFELYDMNGNAWQWCEDSYEAEYYGKSPRKNPLCEQKDAKYRVLRGGSWMSSPDECRAAYRNGVAPDYCGNSVGFRVVLCVN